MTDLKENWRSVYTDIITAGTARSTRRAYHRDVTYFWAWAQLALQHKKECYPASEETVIRFVLDHIGHMDSHLENQMIEKVRIFANREHPIFPSVNTYFSHL